MFLLNYQQPIWFKHYLFILRWLVCYHNIHKWNRSHAIHRPEMHGFSFLWSHSYLHCFHYPVHVCAWTCLPKAILELNWLALLLWVHMGRWVGLQPRTTENVPIFLNLWWLLQWIPKLSMINKMAALLQLRKSEINQWPSSKTHSIQQHSKYRWRGHSLLLQIEMPWAACFTVLNV